MTIEEFENAVMTALLAGDDPLLETLRVQYAQATVRRREEVPGGRVVTFELPADAPVVDRKAMHLDDLQLEVKESPTPVDSSVHVQNGRLRTLEYFVYDGDFPDEPTITAARYYGTASFPGITPELLAARDLEEVLEEE